MTRIERKSLMSTKVTGKVEAAKQALTVYLPDTRGVTISRWGRGNTKIGMDGVYTYSRLPGRPNGKFELLAQQKGFAAGTSTGTCPGSSEECESICYAKRVVNTSDVWDVWWANSINDRLPGAEDPLPDDAKLVRIHVSGDFTSVEYIEDWIRLAESRTQVRFFGYTRSWRVPELLPSLERLRALNNVELFASMDQSTDELPPKGWRRAWLENDLRAIAGSGPGAEQGLEFFLGEGVQNFTTVDGTSGYVCPEETGRRANCQECNFCILGKKGDVIFLLH